MERFKMMKVYDSSIMPDEFMKLLREWREIQGNNTFINWDVGEEAVVLEEDLKENDEKIHVPEFDYKDIKYYYIKGRNIIDDWLLENGAIMGEEVVIHYWW